MSSARRIRRILIVTAMMTASCGSRAVNESRRCRNSASVICADASAAMAARAHSRTKVARMEEDKATPIRTSQGNEADLRLEKGVANSVCGFALLFPSFDTAASFRRAMALRYGSMALCRVVT